MLWFIYLPHKWPKNFMDSEHCEDFNVWPEPSLYFAELFCRNFPTCSHEVQPLLTLRSLDIRLYIDQARRCTSPTSRPIHNRRPESSVWKIYDYHFICFDKLRSGLTFLSIALRFERLTSLSVIKRTISVSYLKHLLDSRAHKDAWLSVVCFKCWRFDRNMSLMCTAGCGNGQDADRNRAPQNRYCGWVPRQNARARSWTPSRCTFPHPC